MVEWVEYAKFFAGLLSIVNPIGSIPVFINLTANQSPHERHRTGLLAAISVGLVLGVVLVTGEALLRFFGITIPSFRVGGGILILLMSISMMNAKLSPVKQTEEEARGEGFDVSFRPEFRPGTQHPERKMSTSSCTLVFRVIPKNSTFQTKVINLDVKTEAISIGNFPLDCS